MAFLLYGTVFVDGTTPVPAAFLNKVRTELPSAVDGRGGSYTNTSDLIFTTTGADFKILGDSNVVIDALGTLTITTPVAGSISYSPSSISRYVNISRAYAPNAARWLYDSANPTTLSTVPRWNQQAVGQDYPLLIPLALPTGQTIEGALIRVKGNSVAGGSNVPGGAPGTAGSSPKVEVVYTDVTSTTVTSLGNALDGATTVAAYNTTHSISLTGLTESVSTSRRYYIRVSGENGINANGLLEVLAAQVTLSVTSQAKFVG